VKQDPYVRAGVVNSAENIYIALEDRERLRALMAQEAATSNTPWYYIGDLADVEEELGNKQRALELMAEAYAKAKGPASRFQWGYNYISGCCHGAGRYGDHRQGRCCRAGEWTDRVHRRTLSRLTKLDKALREWNTTGARRSAREILYPGGAGL
jgi:protein disulfide-isomerase